MSNHSYDAWRCEDPRDRELGPHGHRPRTDEMCTRKDLRTGKPCRLPFGHREEHEFGKEKGR